MKHNSNKIPNDMDMLLIAPLVLDAMRKARKISQKEIIKYMDHVNELIEKPREGHFRDTGIKPVPHPLSPDKVRGQLEITTHLWLRIEDVLGADMADKCISGISLMLAQQDAKMAEKWRRDLV